MDGVVWLKEQLATRERSDECWEWPFPKDKDGYGYAVYNKFRTRAHVLALIFDGKPKPDPPSNNALHSCDNPPCVNPRHLRWGTISDNTQDSIARGRFSYAPSHRGSRSPNAKLTEEAVQSIRSDSRNHRQVALIYGVHPATICRIRNGKAWTHVPQSERWEGR